MKKLFAYDLWANKRVIAAMQQLPEPNERCLQLLSHIFAAQEIWYGRILNNTSTLAPYITRDLDACIAAFHNTAKNWEEYLAAADEKELDRVAHYTNTKGEKFSTPVRDILTHVINHSTYHRAQIVSTLKGKIEKLPVTDYIVFVRESV